MKETQNENLAKNKTFTQRQTKEHHISWVKGHNGNEMNELADELACKASAQCKMMEEN